MSYTYTLANFANMVNEGNLENSRKILDKGTLGWYILANIPNT
jgi:hypothetical protein